MLKSCPNPVDVQDILFKLRCRLKVFNNKDVNNFPNPHSLISCASRYGLLFVGSNSKTLQAIQSKCVENYSNKDKDISNYPRRSLSLPSPPIHICVNCDSTLLAVVVVKDTCPTVIFYDVLSFYKETVTVIKELRLSSTPGVTVMEVSWNPALPAIFTACKSDGTLGVYEIKGNAVDINELPTAAETTSFCWSPKGKQIAVGSRNGKITQYKPDLKAVKIINEPPLEGPHSLISLQWVSNYQFIGVYRPAEPEGQAKLVVVDSSKTGETSYTNYDDVCYSGNGRVPQFYMIMQQHWNLLMVASSNSTEVGVLGSVADTWTQWIISDSARAELPLSSDKQDTLPVGLALDISPSQRVPWGEDTIPPCPYLMILSHHGVLCIFDVVNLKQGVPTICCPVDNVQDTSGLAHFVVEEDKGSVQEKDTFVAQLQPATPFGAPQAIVSETQPFATPQPSLFKTENVKPTQLLPNPAPQPQASVPLSTLLKPNTTEQQFSLGNPSASFFAPKTEAQAAFGAQATLPVAKTSQPSAFLVGETVITPAPKDVTPVTTSNKYSSIFTALNTPSFTPSSAPSKPVIVAEVPPLNISASMSPSTHSIPFTSTPQIPRAESKVLAKPVNLPLKQVSDPKAIVDERVKEETDALLAKMVKDECVALDSELKALLHQGRRVNINIGSDQEKLEMLKQMETLEEFIKEIVDISLGENAEVHNLKQNLILSWAWYEEALSRYNVSKDETMTLLLKSQPLNSATEKRQSDMKKLIYYLESQLSQVNKALDEQWEKFQDYAKKTHRVQMPTMEAIFQSMVRQNAVLQRQTYILKDISSHIKQKKLSSTGPSLFLSLEDSTKKIENDLKHLQIDPDDPHRTLHEQTLKKEKNFTITKRNKLRSFLKSHEVVHVTVVKPQMNSTLPFSPSSKSKEIYSILGARMSPVQKVPVARNLEFPHSTSAKDNKPEIKPTSAPPNTPAHTESQRTFTFKNLKPNVTSTMATNNATSFFTPKSVPSSFSQSIIQPVLPPSTPSAFVPTTQSTKLQSFSQMSEKSNIGSISSSTFSFASVPTGTIPKTNTTNVTESLPSFKGSTPQFSFGSSITITPINKKPEAVSSVSPISTPTSTNLNFSFGGTAKTSTDAKKTTSTSETISQIKSAPLFGSTPSSSTFSFGSMASITASSESTTRTPSGGSISSTTTNTKSLVFGITPSSTPSPTVITQPLLSTPTTTSAFLPFPVTASVTKPSIFGTSLPSASSAPFSSKAVTSSTVTTTVTSSTSFFGNSPATLISGSVTIPSETISAFASKPEATSTPFGSSIVSSLPSSSVTSTSSVSDTKVSASVSVSSNVSSNTVTTTSSTTPILESTPSIFAAAIPTVNAASSTPTASIFGFSTTTTASDVFASAAAPTTSGTSIFGSSPNSATTPIFGTGAPASSTSIFGGSTTSAPSSTSIFGGSTSSAPTSSSIFGGSSTTVKTSSNSTSIFGTSMPSATQASAFGGSPAQPQIFGTPTTTTVFGSSTTVTTSSIVTSQQGSIFSGGSTTQTSIFGTVSTASTQPSVFGSVTPAATTQPSIFASATTTASPVFGNTTTAQSTFGSAFGQTGSIFATPKTTSSAFGTTFGNPSIFGSTPATTAQGFGQTPFGTTATPAFGTPTTASSIFGSGGAGFASVSSSSNLFGSSAASPTFSFATPASNATTGTGAFGFGNLNVGNAATTSSSIFGSGNTFAQRETTPANPFGSGTSIFGNPPSTSSSIFGTNTSNTQSGFGTTAFGSTPAFSQQPAFGQSTFGGTSFGSPQAGPFSAGGTGVGQSGFGSLSGFQKPAGFGAASTFGGSPQPAFGASPSFGGAPAFGAAPAFGSPPKVFGSNTPTAAFGSAATGSPGFGNLATQNTVGFGNLAQQAATPSSTPFAGNSSFSSWR